MDRYMQYRLAEQDEDCVDSFTDLLTNNNGKKNGRGPTQMRDIWGNHDGTKMEITCNEFGQPHDKNASKLTNFIGTLVRDGKNAPINYKSWHKVPDKYKDRMWKIIQEKFDIPPLAENWTMRSCGKELKNWKAYLKRTYYSETLSFEEQKKYKDKRVYAGQWEELIKYWATDDAKKISATNKASRGQKKYNHTTGTKSFAQIRAAQVQLQEKQELNEDVSKEKGMNDTFSEVMGKEKYGSVRMYGFGVCPSDVGEMVNLKSVTADPETIAIGLVVSKDSSKEVGGKELGDHYSEVVVQVCINPDEELIRPYGQYKTIGEVVGASIAWPTTFLVSRKSDKQLHDSMM
uniref:Transposase Tnp1/En/Spm-like domain-containing protein n=1 Tax=Cannabis sativa TaxID=3483 RepID=A0A803NGI5_CANSA